MTENLLKNPAIIIDGVEITPQINIKIEEGFWGIDSFYLEFKLNDGNMQFIKSTKEKVKKYQNTRYNDLNLKNTKNQTTFNTLALDLNSRSIDSILLDIDYKIIDFNSLHLFHMHDDDNKYLIERERYMDICSNDEFNKIIVYGIFKEIS